MQTWYVSKVFLRSLIAVGSLLLTQSANANDSVKVDLKGYIKKNCSITGISGELDLSDTDKGNIWFNLYCNTPFDISVTSHNGGLKNGNIVARYNMSLNIPELGVYMRGSSTQIGRSQLYRSVHKVPFESRGQLSIQMVDKLFYAGTYSERLVIEIYPTLTM